MTARDNRRRRRKAARKLAQPARSKMGRCAFRVGLGKHGSRRKAKRFAAWITIGIKHHQATERLRLFKHPWPIAWKLPPV